MRVKLENILCATDLSDFSNLTLPYGIALAEEFGARLYVCHVVEIHPVGLHGEAYLDPMLELENQQTEHIREQVERMGIGRDVQWEPLVGSGYAPDEIAHLAEEYRVDLVISATHGRSGFRRLILGSVTERLMRVLPCPLLVVTRQDKAPREEDTGSLGLKRLMVGCDFSSDSALALQYALSFAQEFQSELHLVHVVEPSVHLDTPPASLLAGAKEDARLVERTRGRLGQLIPEEARNWCLPVTAVLKGRPDEELAGYAAVNDIDMAFLGVRGRGLIETLIVGSTTDRVVRQASCPVFSARPFAQMEVDASPAVSADRGVEPGLEGEFDLFTAERRPDAVLLRLKPDFMRRATDLCARDGILDHFGMINRADAVKSVIVMGAPDKSGADEYMAFYNQVLSGTIDRNAIHRLFNVIDQIILGLLELDKIIIHADSGKIISIYFNLSLACNYRVVADDAVFQNPCLELGMIPKGGGPFFLSAMLGSSRACEILLAGEAITAARALEMGMVDRVVPPEKLEDAALELAARFGAKPLSSIKGVKRLLNFANRDLRNYLEAENRELLSIVGSPRLPVGGGRLR